MPFLYRLVICTALLFTASQASRIAESRIANVIDEAKGVKIPQSVDSEECIILFPPPKGCYSTGTNAADMKKCPETCEGVAVKEMLEPTIEHDALHHIDIDKVERGHQPKVNAGVAEWSSVHEHLKKAPKKNLELKVGSKLLYRKSTEDAAVSVTLLKVHDDDPPYYTIRMPDGKEKQTIREKLEVQDADFQSVKLSKALPVHHETTESRPDYRSKLTSHVKPSEHTVQPVATNVDMPPICKQLQATNDKRAAEGKPKKKCNGVQRNLCDAKKPGFCAEFD